MADHYNNHGANLKLLSSAEYRFNRFEMLAFHKRNFTF